jgi:putative resolvase
MGQRARPVKRTDKVALWVSSCQAQRPDLRHQRERPEAFCAARGIAMDAWVEEMGGGLNFRRPKVL